jgi:hypothetical protein
METQATVIIERHEESKRKIKKTTELEGTKMLGF